MRCRLFSFPILLPDSDAHFHAAAGAAALDPRGGHHDRTEDRRVVAHRLGRLPVRRRRIDRQPDRRQLRVGDGLLCARSRRRRPPVRTRQGRILLGGARRRDDLRGGSGDPLLCGRAAAQSEAPGPPGAGHCAVRRGKHRQFRRRPGAAAGRPRPSFARARGRRTPPDDRCLDDGRRHRRRRARQRDRTGMDRPGGGGSGRAQHPARRLAPDAPLGGRADGSRAERRGHRPHRERAARARAAAVPFREPEDARFGAAALRAGRSMGAGFVERRACARPGRRDRRRSAQTPRQPADDTRRADRGAVPEAEEDPAPAREEPAAAREAR